MTSLKTANRRIGSLFAVGALVLATVTPGLVPAFASAAQVTERSVALSSSSAGAENVSYEIKFTAQSDAAAVVFDFCENSPLINSTCDAPAGFDAATATASGYTVSQTSETLANKIVLTETGTEITAAPITIVLAGVDNPTATGPLYLRMATYSSEANAQAYTSGDITANAIDQGSAAISITDSIGVSGAVLESMTFCVSAEVIDGANCTDAEQPVTPLDAPVLELGETAGDVTALSSVAVSEGSLYSQISTNAASGATVSLKSDATQCGGLVRFGTNPATVCDIAPALASDIAFGEAKFGVKVAAAADPSGTANGTYQIYGTGGSPYYSDSVFKLNYVDGDGTGITSPYGDFLLDTAGAPVNNKNVEIIFGASIANNTPAGVYSAGLSLIATGKF